MVLFHSLSPSVGDDFEPQWRYRAAAEQLDLDAYLARLYVYVVNYDPYTMD